MKELNFTEADADKWMLSARRNIYKTSVKTLRDIHLCIEIYTRENANEKLAKAYLLLARYSQLTNNYFDIFDYAERVLEYNSGDKKVYCDINSLLSEAHLRLSSPAVALEHARRSLEAAEEMNDDSRLAESYVRLAEIYTDLDRETLAEHYFSRAYEKIGGVNSPYTNLYILAFLCDIKTNANNIKEAKFFLNQIPEFENKFSNYLYVLAYDLRLARILVKEKKFENARKKFLHIYEMAKANKDHLRTSNIEFDLAQLEFEAGNLKKAVQMCKASITEMESVNVHLALDKRYKLLAKILESQGKYKEALSISKKLYFFKVGYLETDLTKLLAYMRKASMYENVKKEKDNAEKLAKLKDQFLANMSHEIRTPMNAIVGMSRLMEKTKLNEVQQKYLSGISQSASNLLVIINDILDFSKIEAGKIVFEKIPFSLEEQIKSVYEILLAGAIEKKLDFSYQIDEGIPELLIGDPVRFGQVLINLAGNALKFTKTGKVQLIAHLISKNEKSALIKVEVIDSGIGIPENKLNDIFKSFTQVSAATTRQFGGSGLGLAICKQLITMQGGKIDVSSKQGKGSNFNFIIEYEIGKEKVKKESYSSAQKMDGIRILLAEDNEFNRIVAEDTLRDLFDNLHLDLAENGKVAITKLEQNDYDIILMDLQMETMDGYEASKIIRSMKGLKSKTPIIALTAHAMKTEMEKCSAAGINDLVTKPFDPENLRIKIYHQLMGHD